MILRPVYMGIDQCLTAQKQMDKQLPIVIIQTENYITESKSKKHKSGLQTHKSPIHALCVLTTPTCHTPYNTSRLTCIYAVVEDGFEEESFSID